MNSVSRAKAPARRIPSASASSAEALSTISTSPTRASAERSGRPAPSADGDARSRPERRRAAGCRPPPFARSPPPRPRADGAVSPSVSLSSEVAPPPARRRGSPPRAFVRRRPPRPSDRRSASAASPDGAASPDSARSSTDPAERSARGAAGRSSPERPSAAGALDFRRRRPSALFCGPFRGPFPGRLFGGRPSAPGGGPVLPAPSPPRASAREGACGVSPKRVPGGVRGGSPLRVVPPTGARPETGDHRRSWGRRSHFRERGAGARRAGREIAAECTAGRRCGFIRAAARARRKPANTGATPRPR